MQQSRKGDYDYCNLLWQQMQNAADAFGWWLVKTMVIKGFCHPFKIMPFAQLEPYVFVHAHYFKTKAFMQVFAGNVWQCNARIGIYKTLLF